MQHIARLFRSAHLYLMEPEFTIEQIVAATKEVVRVNNIDSCYIRPLFYLGYGEMGLNPLPSKTKASIACWPWGAYLGAEAAETGVRAAVSSWQRIGNNTIPPTGKATGIAVLDLDKKNGKDGTQAVPDLEVRTPVIARTGSGGARLDRAGAEHQWRHVERQDEQRQQHTLAPGSEGQRRGDAADQAECRGTEQQPKRQNRNHVRIEIDQQR